MCVCVRGGGGGGVKALLQLATSPWVPMLLLIQKYKTIGSLEGSQRSQCIQAKTKIKLITIINNDEYSWLILLYARVDETHSCTTAGQTKYIYVCIYVNSTRDLQ